MAFNTNFIEGEKDICKYLMFATRNQSNQISCFSPTHTPNPPNQKPSPAQFYRKLN